MANLLSRETSPYLLQHADHPVDWQVWNAETLALARSADKPILLSVGYSTCHWCHVMARESFEDAEVGALMNRHFVCIKVDREERPDLDQIYQGALHSLTGRAGGWPLTLFLAPDGTPFFGGTYFPRTPRYNLPGFMQILEGVALAYRDKRAEILAQNAALLASLAQSAPRASEDLVLDGAPIDAAVATIKRGFDAVHGGFGGAPKFPRPAELTFLFWSGDDEARDRVLYTLDRMAERGLMDQLGGGFFRYSTDVRWVIPHFEKMLYDNGPLLALYADAWAATGSPLYARAAEQLVGWLQREMTSPEGLFHAALDADSEHQEGKYYVWSPAELEALLSAEEYAVAREFWGLAGAPNFDGDVWHLAQVRPLAEVARELDIPVDHARARLDTACARLLEARAARARPGRDDKILTAWNALMIHGLARAGRRFARADWVALAARAADALHSRVWHDGRLSASWQQGRARHNGYLDDYAFLLDALLELAQADWRANHLDWARALARALLMHFEDAERGGFFFTSHDHEVLIHRAKPAHDHATPSGNGVAARALGRLAMLLEEPRYDAARQRCLQLFFAAIREQPAPYPSLLEALRETLSPVRLVVLRGSAADLPDWKRAVDHAADSGTLVFALDAEADGAYPPWEIPTIPRKAPQTGVNAHVCRGVTCLPEIVQLTDVLSIFSKPEVQ